MVSSVSDFYWLRNMEAQKEPDKSDILPWRAVNMTNKVLVKLRIETVKWKRV